MRFEVTCHEELDLLCDAHKTQSRKPHELPKFGNAKRDSTNDLSCRLTERLWTQSGRKDVGRLETEINETL